jgi:hypothetical protein
METAMTCLKKTLLVRLQIGAIGVLAAASVDRVTRGALVFICFPSCQTDLVTFGCMTSKIAMVRIRVVKTMALSKELILKKINMRNPPMMSSWIWLGKTQWAAYKAMTIALCQTHQAFAPQKWILELVMDMPRDGTMIRTAELASLLDTLDATETGTTLPPSRNALPLAWSTVATSQTSQTSTTSSSSSRAMAIRSGPTTTIVTALTILTAPAAALPTMPTANFQP